MGRLPHSAIKAAAVLALASFLRIAPHALGQDATIRVDVRLVRLLVSVKDAAGALVGNLGKSDFTVLDNGVRQEVSVFERHTEQPLSIALLVDTSASTAIELKYELDSVSRFIKAIVQEGNPDDALALYSFNWQVTLNSTFTRRPQRLESALRQLKSEGGTSLYDAIYLASQDLEVRPGRHVLVVVTDGGDTTSSKKYRDALESLHRADAVLYSAVVIPVQNDAGRNTGGEHALATLAASTGGRVFQPSPGAQLDAAFADILRELRTQYLVGYYPRAIPLTKNRFHTLKVNVADPRLRVVTRSGYYGEFEESTGRSPAR